MKMWAIAAGLTCLLSIAWADDYEAALSRIERTSSKIDQKFREMGFTSPTVEEKRSEDKVPKASLFMVHGSLSQLRAETGKILAAKTFTRLVVGPEGSPAVIEIGSGQGVFSGLRVLGLASQASTEGRLLINLDRVVFRSGRVATVKALALDETGAYGLKAQVFSSKALMVAGAMTSSFISGFAAAQQTQSAPNAFGFSQSQPSNRNSVLQGVAQTAADQSKRLIDESTKEKPVLVVESGTPLSVYFEEEARF